MKYRKRPTEVEAFRWTGDETQTEDPEWIVEALREGRARLEGAGTAEVRMWLRTSNPLWERTARPGDYIVQTYPGELWPLHSDLFEAEWQPAEEETP